MQTYHNLADAAITLYLFLKIIKVVLWLLTKNKHTVKPEPTSKFMQQLAAEQERQRNSKQRSVIL
jgi:hypothetical protein